MAIIDFLKKQFIDIIEWTDDSRDTLSYRFPDEDKEIKKGAQLIVRESQVAQFVYLGEFGDTFGPGKHTLTTDNIPILTNLKSWKYALESPFKADVYYVVTRVFTGNKWGTANPVMMRDTDFGVVRLRAYGTYDFRVIDPKKFLKEVAGTTSSPTRCARGSSACSPTRLRARRSRRWMWRPGIRNWARRSYQSSIRRSPPSMASR
jgi:membrane protease subunit (stomatin/prohibitin family)